MDNTLRIVYISVSVVFSLLLPIILLIVWRKKTGARLVPALVGAITFPVFALVLEQSCHSVVLNQPVMQNNTLLYIVYGCLAAGIFEETGRWVAFRVLLRRHHERETSVTYGIGHGGIEAIFLSGIPMVTYLVAAIAMASGGTAALERIFGAATTQTLTTTFATTATPMYLVGGIERVIAVTLHIALSVFVFKAVEERKPVYYVLAVLLHAVADSFAAMYQLGFITSILLVEVLVFAATLCIAYIAFRLYRSMPNGKAKTKPQYDIEPGNAW